MEYLIPVRENDKVTDGGFIKILDYCKRHCFSGECDTFYKSIKPENYNRFLTCPHGLAVYVSKKNDGYPLCFICMRAREHYNKAKAKKIANQAKTVYSPVLDAQRYYELIESSLSIQRENDVLTEKQASIGSISHEVKKLNAQIKDRSDAIIQTYNSDSTPNAKDYHDLVEMVKTIYVCSAMVNTRFSLLDYEKNPQALAQGAVFECNVYKKFDKMKIIFSNYLGRRVPIHITGSSYRCIEAYPTFEMIPLLLIDNAVKYSYENNPVEIHFENVDRLLIVTISSYSPYCSQTDLDNIYKKGYRGKNAARIADGSGIGLFFVKMLCDLHGIEIKIHSDKTRITEINGIAFAPFCVELQFKNTYE